MVVCEHSETLFLWSGDCCATPFSARPIRIVSSEGTDLPDQPELFVVSGRPHDDPTSPPRRRDRVPIWSRLAARWTDPSAAVAVSGRTSSNRPHRRSRQGHPVARGSGSSSCRYPTLTGRPEAVHNKLTFPNGHACGLSEPDVIHRTLDAFQETKSA